MLLGCRQILFDSLASRHRDEFASDFANTGDETLRVLLRDITRAFAGGEHSLRAMQKNVFLMDAFFAGHSEAVAQMMAGARAQGRVSLLESLLLFNFGFLFRLCGELLERCDHAPEAQALLCPRMEICVAGNGGQFLKYFDTDARNKLFGLALSGLNDQHPVRELLLVQSREPKQEVAIGLLADDERLRSSIQGMERMNPAQAVVAPIEHRQQLLKDYLPAFYAAFPQAGEKLMGSAFDHNAGAQIVRLRPAAEIELDAVLDNELSDDTEEFAGYVRAFAAIKRLWGI